MFARNEFSSETRELLVVFNISPPPQHHFITSNHHHHPISKPPFTTRAIAGVNETPRAKQQQRSHETKKYPPPCKRPRTKSTPF
jgi:hypothetical protein